MGRSCKTPENINAYMVLVRKPEGKRALGRTRSRGDNNIKIELREIGWGCMDWIHLVLVLTGTRIPTP
jgi:hypothetical protein